MYNYLFAASAKSVILCPASISYTAGILQVDQKFVASETA
jgi:hypothetical protein